MKEPRSESLANYAGGPVGKANVAGVLERGGEVRTAVVTKRRKKLLQGLIRSNVEDGSELFANELKSYDGLETEITPRST